MIPNIARLAMAQMPSAAQTTLQSLREVEGTHGPLCCFASSKFTQCKLIGLFQPDVHLNTFLSSPEGQRLSTRMGRAAHVAAWGDATGHEETKRVDFNNQVIPVIKTWGTGPNAGMLRSAPLDFVHVWRNPAAANRLLQDKVPLMVCVQTPWTKHLVVIVQGADGTNWLIDPWETSDYASVVSLGRGDLFTTSVSIRINAGQATIPSTPMFHAYFVQRQTPVKCTLSI